MQLDDMNLHAVIFISLAVLNVTTHIDALRRPGAELPLLLGLPGPDESGSKGVWTKRSVIIQKEFTLQWFDV